MSITKIKEIIDQNNFSSSKDLFAHFQTDLESIIIASILLDFDYKEVSQLFLRTISSDDEILRLVDTYGDEPIKYQEALIPKNVNTAFLMLIAYIDKKELSKSIVMEIKKHDNYLSQIKKENIFDKDIILISAEIDFKSDDFIDQLRNSFFTFNVFFIEPEFKNLYRHFELMEFSQFVENNINDLTKKINELRQDIVLPMSLDLWAKIEEDQIAVKVDYGRIENYVTNFLDQINLNELLKDFWKDFVGEMKSELVENAIKYSLTNNWGLASLDIGVKGIKSLLLSINNQNTQLNDELILNNYKEFSLSGCFTVKEWYISKLKNDLNSLEKNAKMKFSDDLPNDFFEDKYQRFISQYFSFYFRNSENQQNTELSHTEIFFRVYDFVNNFQSKIKGLN